MKKKMLITITIIVVIAMIIALIPFFRYIPYYFIVDIRAGGPQYEKECISEDGHITFLCNNKYGLKGIGSYSGVYTDDEGNEYVVDIVIDGNTYARTENDNDTEVYRGKGRYNVYMKAFIIKVEEVDLECSVYQPGDRIIFHEK